jgi:hypothetical protein
MKGPLVFLGIIALGAGAVLALRGGGDPTPSPDPIALVAAADLPTMTVYKSPTCGCCGAWVEHMREAGFTVEVEDVADLAPIKSRLGVPAGMASCHTAVIGDYVVEGHVPADDVRRFLSEATDLAGLAVPGMPAGSPGMEVPGQPAASYDVMSFGKDGSTRVYASH